MKFTIKYIALVFLSFAISFSLCLAVNLAVKTSEITPLGKTRAGLNNIKSLLVNHAQTSNTNWERIFQNQKPNIATEIGTDPWGNDYQIRGKLLSSNELQDDFPYVYSLGPDGRSETLGNDNDDINSWDNHHVEYYGKRQETARRTNLAIWSILISPIIFVAIVLLTHRRNGRPKQPD